MSKKKKGNDWYSEMSKHLSASNTRTPGKVEGPCWVCIVLRAGNVPLMGRFMLDGPNIPVCDKCMNTIIELRNEPEAEGKQWNWEPILSGIKRGGK